MGASLIHFLAYILVNSLANFPANTPRAPSAQRRHERLQRAGQQAMKTPDKAVQTNRSAEHVYFSGFISDYIFPVAFTVPGFSVAGFPVAMTFLGEARR